jgi:hypothetical protein
MHPSLWDMHFGGWDMHFNDWEGVLGKKKAYYMEIPFRGMKRYKSEKEGC